MKEIRWLNIFHIKVLLHRNNIIQPVISNYSQVFWSFHLLNYHQMEKSKGLPRLYENSFIPSNKS